MPMLRWFPMIYMYMTIHNICTTQSRHSMTIISDHHHSYRCPRCMQKLGDTYEMMEIHLTIHWKFPVCTHWIIMWEWCYGFFLRLMFGYSETDAMRMEFIIYHALVNDAMRMQFIIYYRKLNSFWHKIRYSQKMFALCEFRDISKKLLRH